MDGVQWDDANRNHIARHGVTVEEAEEIISDDPVELDVQYEADELRTSWLGETLRGRMLVVAFTDRDGLIRPVTAYEPGVHLKRFYFRQRGLQ